MMPPDAMMGGAPGASPQASMPAPDHKQTVAALRHFEAIGKQLKMALKDPDLGRADLRSKVIDGMTSLVASRILSPGEAVQTLATFPERPYEQKIWMVDHYKQTLKARDDVLDHHKMAYAGAGPEPTPSGDNHMQDIAAMMNAHYRNGAE